MKNLTFDRSHFYIDDVPVKLVSGVMHYFRIHPAYWQDRLLKLKESGCNCVETYLCWNLHEKREGQLDFSGWLDFTRFLNMAAEVGLYAIVRPGPYICSEWDLGGMPWWLLKHPDINLRCSDPLFLQLCTPYMEEVCRLLRPLLITNGGNVILIQVENEYGSFGNDAAYLRWLRDFYISHGIDCPLITSDGPYPLLLRSGTVDGVLASVNMRKDSGQWLKALDKAYPDQPRAIMELWTGHANHWNTDTPPRDLQEVADSVEEALDQTELLNIYMFHGGSTFGFMNGASPNIVQMSTYDVDAPLDEFGRKTPKYYAMQKLICKAMNQPVHNTTTDTVLREYPDVRQTGVCSLRESGLTLRCIHSPTAKTMEACDQGYGYIIYTTTFTADAEGMSVVLPDVQDYAHVYIDGQYRKTLFRTDSDRTIPVGGIGTHAVGILVENMGRYNSGWNMTDRKGMLGQLRGREADLEMEIQLYGYDIYSLPLEELPTRFDAAAAENEPAFYRYELQVDTPEDTVVHFEGFTRGVAFLNGFNLGRHWDTVNPNNRLFIPAPLLKKGKNELIVFDVLHKPCEKKVLFREIK